MTNKKRIVLSFLCLMLLVFSVFSFSACKNEVENFNLSFKVNGETYETITTSGDEAIAIPENPTKEGYTFDGWYWDKDVWSKPFTANSLMDAPISSDMSVYAKFSAIEYDITYENDGGTHSNPVSYTIEDSFTLSDAEKIGYTFVGWYSDAAYTTKVESVSAGSKGAIALYAKFEINNYTISYGNTMDAVNSNVTSYNVNTDTITLSDLSKTGYVFEGWYNGEEKVTEIAKGSTGDITLTAKWSVIGYDITYHNVDGATNSNPTAYDVENQPLALSDASKDGYRFLGWYTDAALANKVSEIAIGTTGDINLYAKWELIEYTAIFMDGDTVVETIKFTVESESITEPPVPNHVGYTGAWANYTLGAENIIVDAIYTPIPYTIRYENTKDAVHDNQTSYTIESESITLENLSKTGYIFEGWYDENDNQVTVISKGSLGNIILTAKWTTITYTITFLYDNAIGDYAEGTTVKTTYTVEDEFEFAALVCKVVGYTFDGWYTEKNVGAGVKMLGITKGTAGDITVYAQFGLEEYDITYNNVNGATNNNPTHYNAASEDFTIHPLTKEGYTFDGWFTNEECTTPANLTIAKGSNGDITLYAKWTPITYTIEYVTYGGTATGNPTKYIVTDNITFNNATLSGYVFKGWYTAAEGGSKVTGITAGTTGNIILYAHWDYVSTITFESNGGSPVNSISNVEGTTISAPVAPTKEHYTFAGWYSDAALKNAYSFTTQPAEDITLYAKWTPVVYEIEYVLNGGTNSENNVVEYTVEDKIELYAPNKVGYTFIGWFTDAEFTSSVVTELKVGTSGKITLYAHYSINQYTISFESNGGTSVSAITQNYATSVTAPEAPSKNGYTFAGWYSNASLTSKYTFATMPSEDITLYAKWDLANYNIAYNLNGGTNNSGNPATYTITSAKITLKAPTKTGYSFAGWYTDAECTDVITEIASGSYGVVELFAKWTATEYTITYVTADGATHSNILTYTIETDLTTLADATLKGHAFGGWYTDDSYATAVTTVAGGEIDNITLYAKFTANTYNVWLDGNEEASCVVSFNLNGAEGTIASQTVTPTATLKYPTVPTRDGYIFAGWYENESCTGSLYDFTAVVTSDTTLYAKWVKVENATAIAINGSSNVTLNGKYEKMLMFVPLVSGNITITASGSYDTFGVLYSSDMAVLAQDDDTASDGVNFLIIYNVTAGQTYYIGARAFSSTTTGTATVNITGSTTVLDGGYAVTASKGSATYGQNFTLNVPNARDGYKFLGYADENGVMYTDATGTSVKVWDKDSDTTLYSQWERAVYTVTFVTSGGTPIDSIELAYGERLDIGKYVTTRSGYSFNGWYLDGTEYNATTMPDHDITLTAYWKTFALGTIKYDVDKIAISVDDEITADLFSAICLDTDGNLATFTVSVNGTQAVGETITIRLIASSGTKSKQVTISNIKVYGDPTLEYDTTVSYINISDELTAEHFNASGLDTFGNPTKILVYAEEKYEAGDIITIIVASVDDANNITYGFIHGVKVYGLPKITYTNKTAISINDTIDANTFNAFAIDSFGESVAVNVSLQSGTISAGNAITIRISATDSKGNVTNIDVQCNVYATPTISDAYNENIKVNDIITADLLGITAVDTYGEEIPITLVVKEGTQSAGTILTVTAKVSDVAGNVTERDYQLKVYGIPSISCNAGAIKDSDILEAQKGVIVEFNLMGGTGDIATQVITQDTKLLYPNTPTKEGYAFAGWYSEPECINAFDFTSAIDTNLTLYAGWKKINFKTSSIDRNVHLDITDNYNSASNAFVVSTSKAGVRSSGYYMYFTVLTSGTYRICYKVDSSNEKTFLNLHGYNETDQSYILNVSARVTNSYRSTTFTAEAGDLVCFWFYRLYDYSANVSFYIYGDIIPDDGGTLSEDCNNYLYLPARDLLSTTAYDSFGKPLDVDLRVVKGNQIGGQYIEIELTTTDIAGNKAILNRQIKVYSEDDISLTYSAGASDIASLLGQGKEFNVQSKDSFGNDCYVYLEAADGSELCAGTTTDIRIVARDVAGNEKRSDIIKNIKIYDLPTVHLNQEEYIITENTNIDFLFTIYDSFGEELIPEISISGDISTDDYVTITIYTIDDAQNVLSRSYVFAVEPLKDYYVELYVNGILWNHLFLESSTEYDLPILENCLFYGWHDDNGEYYAYEDGIGIKNIDNQKIKLHATCFSTDYIKITNKDQFMNMSSNGKYVLWNDLDFEGATIESFISFNGVLDGNNHTIYNFSLSSKENNALIMLNNGVIKNLKLSGLTISETTDLDETYVAALVSKNYGEIINCFVNTSITVNRKSNDSFKTLYIGGITAYNAGVVHDCTSDVQLKGWSSVGVYGFNYIYVGGIAGYNAGELVDCVTTGSIFSDSNTGVGTAGRSCAGGIAGCNSNIIRGCRSSASVRAEGADVISYAGGIVAYSEKGSISQCIFDGSVSTTGSWNANYAGGIAGYINDGLCSNSYTTGTVSATCNASLFAGRSIYVYAGGICGYFANGKIECCYSTGNVNASNTYRYAGSNCSGYHYAYAYASGINARGNATISNCFTASKVTASASSTCSYNHSYGSSSAQSIGSNSENCYYSNANSYGSVQGTAISSTAIKTSDFVFDSLNWDENVWAVMDGEYPTLK